MDPPAFLHGRRSSRIGQAVAAAARGSGPTWRARSQQGVLWRQRQPPEEVRSNLATLNHRALLHSVQSLQFFQAQTWLQLFTPEATLFAHQTLQAGAGCGAGVDAGVGTRPSSTSIIRVYAFFGTKLSEKMSGCECVPRQVCLSVKPHIWNTLHWGTARQVSIKLW